MSSANETVKTTAHTVAIKEEVEKSKMLRNEDYDYFDTTLTNERQRCVIALNRYNEACQLTSGLDEEAANELLEMIMKPANDKIYSFIVPCTQEGTLEGNVKIEAPFTTFYGYNLKIRENVHIHRHCKIDDVALVEIGPRTYIGPNVNIITSEMRHKTHGRKGVFGQWIARPVTIGEDAYIGPNAIILTARA